MKREILDQIEKYKAREFHLTLLVQNGETSEEQYKEALKEMRQERFNWLISLGGGFDGLDPESAARLNSLAKNAESELINATILKHQMVDFIKRANNSKTLMKDYDRVVDDYAQLEFLANENAKSSVASLVKFNNKRNRKNFLSNIICKFKKARVQSKEQEKESE